MGDYFVGTLWAIAFALLGYRGHKPRKGKPSDNLVANLGCVFAIGVSLFPTSQGSKTDLTGGLHLLFAFLFFLTLIYFCLCLFTLTDPDGTPTERKLLRNTIYRVCGYTMGVCILLIGIYLFLLPPDLQSSLEPYHPIYWLETMAVMFFGISWLIKAEVVLEG